MQLSHRKMECAQRISLLVILTKPESRCGSWCASDTFGRISEEPEELRYHFTVVIPSYFMFFYDFDKFDFASM